MGIGVFGDFQWGNLFWSVRDRGVCFDGGVCVQMMYSGGSDVFEVFFC
ncbi:hypothetical protein SLEP1_g9047 [Rubroshorea leprosula]|uniref:Uncharacterized protein n=1 Tax=Rubroshorea leprosula TaxID=152421 RepID=A0AAV5IEX1_9ROSI|nr:hypothetical protein SLEP1_g9047 [Rubroshorea leprosula]